MALELLPEVVPVDFGSLEFERLKADVSDEEIDKGLDRLKQQQKRSEPVAEPRPAKLGDTAVIDFVGKQDGVAFDGGSAEGHHLELGSGNFIPGFEDQLVGMAVDETREITVTFPEGYGAENLAGKPATFTVTLKELREPAEVEIDEAFAKQFGLDSVDALRTAVREQLERDYAQAARLKLKRKLLDKLAEAHDFEVPAGMVDAEFDVIWKQVEEAKKQGRLDPETEAKSEDELKTEYRTIADRRVRLGLVLSEVGRINNISVKDDELKRAVIDEARKYPGQERHVIEYYRKNPDAMGSLRAPLFEEKVVDFILEMAKLTDRTVPPAELFEEPEAATA
jgi:trigger factor